MWVTLPIARARLLQVLRRMAVSSCSSLGGVRAHLFSSWNATAEAEVDSMDENRRVAPVRIDWKECELGAYTWNTFKYRVSPKRLQIQPHRIDRCYAASHYSGFRGTREIPEDALSACKSTNFAYSGDFRPDAPVR